jgi:Carboxypeptidase regulatory-like domain
MAARITKTRFLLVSGAMVFIGMVALVWTGWRPGPGRAHPRAVDHHPAAILAGGGHGEVPPATALSGVVETPDGRLVAHAHVTLSRDLPGASSFEVNLRLPLLSSTTTAADGRFSFPAVGQDDYVVAASAAHFKPARQSVARLAPRSRVRLILVPGGVPVSGRVLDTGGGPIAFADVTSVGRGRSSGLTHVSADAAGHFILDLEAGTFSITARAAGYARQSQNVVLLAARSDLVFRLDPAARVSFSVVGDTAADSPPVPQASLSIAVGGEPAPIELLVTDEQGRTSASLREGRYSVEASHSGRSARVPFQVRLGAPNEVKIELGGGLRAEGHVRRAGGAAVESATVELVDAARRRSTARSDAAGHFAFANLLPGRYTLRARAEGGGEVSGEVDVFDHRTDLVLTFESSVKIVGRVVEDQDRPVANASVSLRPIQESSYAEVQDRTIAGPDGKFELVAAPGVYSVEARRGTDEGRTKVSAVAGRTNDAVIHLGHGRYLSGTVRWDDGVPIGAAVVTARLPDLHTGATAATMPDGTYQVGPFAPGSRVVVRSTGPHAGMGPRRVTGVKLRYVTRPNGTTAPEIEDVDSPNSRVVIIEGSDVQNVDLVLARPTSHIAGKVTDQSGQPVGDATVVAITRAAAYEMSDEQLGRAANRGVSDASGSFSLTDLEPGRYAVVALHPDYGRSVRDDVESGASGVLVRFAERGRLTGEVVDEHGSPVHAFAVSLRGNGSFHDGTPAVHLNVTDPAGRFDIAPCPVGDLALSVTGQSSGSRAAQIVSVRPGEVRKVTVRIALP